MPILSNDELFGNSQPAGSDYSSGRPSGNLLSNEELFGEQPSPKPQTHAHDFMQNGQPTEDPRKTYGHSFMQNGQPIQDPTKTHAHGFMQNGQPIEDPRITPEPQEYSTYQHITSSAPVQGLTDLVGIPLQMALDLGKNYRNTMADVTSKAFGGKPVKPQAAPQADYLQELLDAREQAYEELPENQTKTASVIRVLSSMPELTARLPSLAAKLASTAASKIGRYTGATRAALAADGTRAFNATHQFPQGAENAVVDNLKQVKSNIEAESSNKFNQVLNGPEGSKTVPLDKHLNDLDEMIKNEIPSKRAPLETYKEDLLSQNPTVSHAYRMEKNLQDSASSSLRANAGPSGTAQQGLSAVQSIKLKNSLRNAMDDAMTGPEYQEFAVHRNAELDPIHQGEVEQALESGNHNANTVNDVKKAWEESGTPELNAAKQNYAENVAPGKSQYGRTIGKLSSATDATKAVNNVMNADPVTASHVYASLDDVGREAMQTKYIQDVMKKATGEGGNISDALKLMEQRKGISDTFFPGESQATVDGLQKMLKASKYSAVGAGAGGTIALEAISHAIGIPELTGALRAGEAGGVMSMGIKGVRNAIQEGTVNALSGPKATAFFESLAKSDPKTIAKITNNTMATGAKAMRENIISDIARADPGAKGKLTVYYKTKYDRLFKNQGLDPIPTPSKITSIQPNAKQYGQPIGPDMSNAQAQSVLNPASGITPGQPTLAAPKQTPTLGMNPELRQRISIPGESSKPTSMTDPQGNTIYQPARPVTTVSQQSSAQPLPQTTNPTTQAQKDIDLALSRRNAYGTAGKSELKDMTTPEKLQELKNREMRRRSEVESLFDQTPETKTKRVPNGPTTTVSQQPGAQPLALSSEEKINKIMSGKRRNEAGFINMGNPEKQVLYHGSPEKFDKFDLSKSKTGEGTEMHGHGVYLSKEPQNASYYAESNANFRNKPNKYVYEVEAPHDDNLLDKDKSLMNQSDYVKDRLVNGVFKPEDGKSLGYVGTIKDNSNRTVAPNNNSDWVLEKEGLFGKKRYSTYNPNDFLNSGNGESLYHSLSNMVGSQEKASKMMKDNGILGLKRNTEFNYGNGTTNSGEYVIFDPRDAEIKKINNISNKKVGSNWKDFNLEK